MRRMLFTALLLLVVAVGFTASAAAAGDSAVRLTPVERLPFPERGFVVDVPLSDVKPSAVEVRENGRRVRYLEVSPLDVSGLHFGTVLAIDASESMTGAPLRAAVAALRTFVSHREGDQQIGVIAFNDTVSVLQALTSDDVELHSAVGRQPAVAHGTRIYDAVDEALTMLKRAKLSTGSIVLLSDGADVGSQTGLEPILAKAGARHVRIFTVGLRSGSFDRGPLRTLAEKTGGVYLEAPTVKRLKSIYAELGRRLAGEYLVRYRSDAAPHSRVQVTVDIRGVGSATKPYTAPTPAGLTPFHRSLATRFLLSTGATLAVALLVAGMAAFALFSFLRPRRSTVVERVTEFAGRDKPARRPQPKAPRMPRLSLPGAHRGWFGKLEQDVEIARIDWSATRIVLVTLAATVVATIVMAMISPVFAILGLLTPLAAKSMIGRKLKKVRDAFADQLPPNLQVLASALRVGHSFVGALTVVVENAHEPSQSELRRVITDEQLGVPVDEAIHRVALRMASRDLEQVALLAEVQRTAGGNAAEVLDTVVETLRERADLRRLIKTLTAQGRMARWILTGLPIVAGLAMWLLQGELMRPLFTTGGGQVALVVATLMVVAGSLVIQKMVDIKV